MDYDWGRVVAGVSAAYHGGAGKVETRARADGGGPGAEEEVASWLVSVHPYVGIDVTDRAALWAVLGHGRGSMTMANAGGEEETPIWMTMGAVGVRGELLSAEQAAPFGLAVKADGMLLRTGSEAVGRLPEVRADVQRVRVVLEGSVDALSGSGGVLTPTLAVGARYDGGAAETGAGLEVSGGMRYANPAWGLTAAAGGRLLVAHEGERIRAVGSRRLAAGGAGADRWRTDADGEHGVGAGRERGGAVVVAGGRAAGRCGGASRRQRTACGWQPSWATEYWCPAAHW